MSLKQKTKKKRKTHPVPRPPGIFWCRNRVKSVEPEGEKRRRVTLDEQRAAVPRLFILFIASKEKTATGFKHTKTTRT